MIVELFGLTVSFPEKGGPRIIPQITSAEQVDRLRAIDPQEVLYVFETIRLVKPHLQVPLIGFCGGPFTVATYMIDAESPLPFQKIKAWIQEDPSSLHRLLGKITDASIAYLKGQVAAGATVLQIFDSWANVLTLEEFRLFCLPYLKQMVDALKGVPVIVFCRDSSVRAQYLAELAPAGISCDWHVPMGELRKAVPSSIAIQGSLNPELLRDSLDLVLAETRSILASMKGERGFIFNLGHGVLPTTPMDNVRKVVEAVHTSPTG